MTSILHNMNRNGHDANPFGYDFPSHQQHNALTEPPSVPMGAPLLNDAESGFLGDFFTQPGDFFSFPNLDLTGAALLHDHQNAGSFNWMLEDVPPVLIDAQPTPRVMASPNTMPAAIHTTEFFHPISNGSHSMGPDTSDLFSTNTLVDNRLHNQAQLHISPPHMTSRSPSQRPKSSSTIRPELTSSYSMPSTITAIAPPQSTFGFRANSNLGQLDTTVTYTADFHQDGSHSAPPGQQQRLTEQLTDARYYRFGTDAHFSGGEFKPLHQGEQGKVLEKSMTKNLWLLGRDVKHEEHHQIGGTVTTPPELGSDSKKRMHDSIDDARDGSPLDVKRIKADHTESGDENGDLAVRRPGSQQRGSNGPAKLRRINSSASDASPNGNRRRRNSSSMPQGPPPTSNGNGNISAAQTAAANAKAARENLSEEQKRSNHIMSEQKRRNLIKAGFEDLHNMVPELKQGGLSKSNVLVETANFLELVINANMELKKRLGRL